MMWLWQLQAAQGHLIASKGCVISCMSLPDPGVEAGIASRPYRAARAAQVVLLDGWQ